VKSGTRSGREGLGDDGERGYKRWSKRTETGKIKWDVRGSGAVHSARVYVNEPLIHEAVIEDGLDTL
jgi:hypothetical protein